MKDTISLGKTIGCYSQISNEYPYGLKTVHYSTNLQHIKTKYENNIEDKFYHGTIIRTGTTCKKIFL